MTISRLRVKCVTGPSQQSSASLLVRVQEIRKVHPHGSLGHEVKSSHGNVVFSCVHAVHHVGERILFLPYILLHVREVRAKNMNIILCSVDLASRYNLCK